MCERMENEPWYSYAFRQVVEKPAAVMAIIGWVAAGVLYCDLREFVAANTVAIQQVSEKLELSNQDMRARLDQILSGQKDLEYWHKQQATKK
jgi:hypothetical protein